MSAAQNELRGDKLNNIIDVFFHLDFDVSKIATAAQEDKHYHSAVAFSEILFNMKKNPKHLKNPSYLQYFKISYETAKKMYKKALLIHDKKLSKWGPYGDKHRCRPVPFKSQNMSNVIPNIWLI